ncbi:MAG: tetratricopeptide repeat protein [Chloroflexota bacterium]
MPDESIRLPAQPTALVGRDDDVRHIRALVERDRKRLITLTGPGGSGKTRLAIAAATHLADLFPDGVRFVDLSALRDPALVPAAIAQQLEVRTTSDREATAAIVRALGARRVLLLLDNFEQVIDASPIVAELLTACPGLMVLATSRRPLDLRWEAEWPVGSLAAPDAVALFIERARDADPALPLGKETREAIAAVCEQLDRLPLAIELAAARVRTVPPRLMRTQLERRLVFLDSGARDLPERHRTLANTVGWSFDLLTEEDQRLFCSLAVFAGGFTESAARAVLDLPAGGVRDALGFLVECSLLQLVEHEPQRRFAMLETIRQFAAECLASDEVGLRRRHAEYFAALAERAEPELWGPEQVARYRELEREHDNARAALAWCIERREADLALRLVAALWTLWFTHGYLAEGARWMDAALRLPGWTSARHRALAALRTGDVMSARGDHTSAAALIAEARVLFDELRDDAGVRQAMESEAFTAMERGHWEQAATVYESLRELARAANDNDVLATATRNLASVMRGRGDVAAAERLYEESLPLLAAVGRTRHIAHVLQYLAHLVQRRGDLERAVGLSRQSLESFQELGGVRCFGEELQDLALLAARAGHAERALRLFGAAASVRDQIELALTALEQREHDQAIATARSAVGRDAERALAEGHAMRVEDALEYAHDTLNALGGAAPSPRAEAPEPQDAQLHREGEVWSVSYAGQTLRVRDSKGLRYLARLLREPGREFHALDLAGAASAADSTRLSGEEARDLSAAGQAQMAVIDPEARAAYRERLRDLDDEEREAERFGDTERAARTRAEREFIAAELTAAFGLGGKARTAATDAERARVAVTKAIKAALARIAEGSPALGRHLDATVRTGTFCSYTPDPRAPITWHT